MKLHELLRVTPDETEISALATRARRSALARLSDGAASASGWSWKPLVAALSVAVVVTLVWMTDPSLPEPPAVSEPHTPLRVQMILSDGTRVEWTFLEDFRL